MGVVDIQRVFYRFVYHFVFDVLLVGELMHYVPQVVSTHNLVQITPGPSRWWSGESARHLERRICSDGTRYCFTILFRT